MQMDEEQYTWEYHGGDEQYRDTTFTCPPGTALLDDIRIERIQSHVFYLRMIKKGTLFGFYYVKEDGVEKKIDHLRTPGHIRPVDEYIKFHGLKTRSSEEIEDHTPNSESSIPVHPPPPPQENDANCSSAVLPDSTPSSIQVLPYKQRLRPRKQHVVYFKPKKKTRSSEEIEDHTPNSESSIPVHPPPPPQENDANCSSAVLPDSTPSSIQVLPYKQRLRPRKQHVVYFKPKKKRTKRTPRRVRPPPKYAQKKGNNKMQPLTKEEAKELRIRPKTEKRWVIYMVRGWRNDGNRDDWQYEGKSYNCFRAIPLPVEWFNEYGMDKHWRAKTFQKHPEFWFKVPVSANLTSTEDLECAPASIIKFCNFVGLDELTEKLRLHCRYGSSIGFCIHFLTRRKGFRRLKLKLNNFDPLFPKDQYVLYLVQIAAINTTNKDIDNTHAICIFGNLIFDVNHVHPLMLNKQNLDNCCLGGDSWVFHHVSKLAVFSPTRDLFKKIIKVFLSKYVALYRKYELY